jgi:hypothetical protein
MITESLSGDSAKYGESVLRAKALFIGGNYPRTKVLQPKGRGYKFAN